MVGSSEGRLVTRQWLVVQGKVGNYTMVGSSEGRMVTRQWFVVQGEG